MEYSNINAFGGGEFASHFGFWIGKLIALTLRSQIVVNAAMCYIILND